MKNLFVYLLVLLPFIGISQSKQDIYKVKYEQFHNGNKAENDLDMFYSNQIVYLSKSDSKIQHFIDLQNEENISTINYEGAIYKNTIPFSELPKAEYKDSIETILKYKCKYAKYIYFSNTIEVWFTEDAKAKGSPYSRFLPNGNSLALKILVNGNRETIASSIEKIDEKPIENFSEAKQVTEAEFEEIKINSRFTKLQVFDNEQINFDPEIEIPKQEDLKENTTYHFSKGSVILKKIKLTPELKKSGYAFAKLNCKSNGDAYDRTGSVFIVPADDDGNTTILDAYLHGLEKLPVFKDKEGQEYQGIKREKNYIPPIELMRFFTSFGASHFNEKRAINNYDWADDVEYKQEVTSLIPNTIDEIWVGVFIGNYDKGGHIVSLELDFYPNFEEDEAKDKFILPLFSTINTMEMSGQNYGRFFGNDTLEVDFEITNDLEKVQLLYTSTGHGGWGNGDEFNPKLNQLLIDGKEIFSVVPWRTDCATYRFSNPASGNFGNGLSSSDLSRSNWCPATLTPPYVIPLSTLEKGKHQIKVIIDQGENEGSSFSHWGVTGVIVGETIN